jgi:hypothetical protein
MNIEHSIKFKPSAVSFDEGIRFKIANQNGTINCRVQWDLNVIRVIMLQ